MNSASVVWDLANPEQFRFLMAVFDVRAAKRILAARPRRVMTMLTRSVDLLGLVRTRESPAVADLSVPIILATVADTVLPIDGYHRIKHALATGVDTVRAVMLSAEETELIRRR